jgi:transcriptional regulator GlxA family with amidase domain
VDPPPPLERRVVVVVYPDFQSLDAFGPLEVFDHAATALGRRAYGLELVAPERGPVRSSNGAEVVVQASLADTTSRDDSGAAIDTLLVAGGNGVYSLVRRPEVIDEVARLASGARRVASVCTGAYLLAETGLLDGHRATTHWLACDDLQARHPRIEVDAEPIFIRSGRVATSAGVTAGMDLALHFVEEDHGRALALDVARSLVMFLRRPGSQAQLSAPLTSQLADAEPLRDLQSWVVEHLDEDLSVARLAGRLHQSPRTFVRRFRAEVGMPPGRWVEHLRLEQARRLLEDTDEPVEIVARRCGMQAEPFRRLFHRRLGVGPREYRRRFGAAAVGLASATRPRPRSQP